MDDRLSIGFDLGRTQVRAALVDDGKILRRASALTDVGGGPNAVMAQFRALSSQVCEGDNFDRVEAIGIAAPGPLDSETGIVDHIPTLPDGSFFRFATGWRKISNGWRSSRTTEYTP